MVKIKAPFGSITASGKLGGVLGFRTDRRGNSVGRKRHPKQPRTLAQRATRSWMSWLSSQWSTLSEEQQATWSFPQFGRDQSPYHVFIRHNTDRIKNLPGLLTNPSLFTTWPGQTFPITRTGALGSYTGETTTPGVGYLDFKRNITTINQQWGYAYFWITTEYPKPVYRSLVRIETVQTTGWLTTRIANLTAGPCTIKFVRFSTNGLTTTWWSTISTTIL